MSPFPESRGGPLLAVGIALGLALAVAGSVWLAQAPDTALPPGGEPMPVGHTAGRPAGPATDQGTGLGATTGTRSGTSIETGNRLATTPRAPLSAAARDMASELDRLTALPPGDQAIAVGQHLAATATPAQAPAFLEALLRTTDPAVERVAIAALVRTADSAVVQDLAGAYGTLPAEQRGRVLQVLEGVSHPAALDGLTRVIAADTGERRSPVTMSALYGVASVGTMDSVDYLLQQTRTDNLDLALMAMERVRTRQGVELIRAAAAGSKGHEQLDPSLRPHLGRIASLAEAQLRP
jgi:hypothetical protein